MRIRASLFANPELPRAAAAHLARNRKGVSPKRKLAPKRKNAAVANPAVAIRPLGKGVVLMAPAPGRRLAPRPKA